MVGDCYRQVVNIEMLLDEQTIRLSSDFLSSVQTTDYLVPASIPWSELTRTAHARDGNTSSKRT